MFLYLLNCIFAYSILNKLKKKDLAQPSEQQAPEVVWTTAVRCGYTRRTTRRRTDRMEFYEEKRLNFGGWCRKCLALLVPKRERGMSTRREGRLETCVKTQNCYLCTSRSARYNVWANYYEPRLPATKCLVPNTNYMNNIFKPVID
jgi:hypothetical protein